MKQRSKYSCLTISEQVPPALLGELLLLVSRYAAGNRSTVEFSRGQYSGWELFTMEEVPDTAPEVPQSEMAKDLAG